MNAAPLTRRGLLTLSAAAALPAAGALAGCGADGIEHDEVAILSDALALELSLVAAYETGADLLDGTGAETAELFARQEREHADLLRAAVVEAGGTPVEPRSPEGFERILRLDELADGEEFMRFAVDLEQTAIGAYNVAVPKLVSPDLRRTVYAIGAAEAAHMTVWLGELGELQAPDPFVAGARA